MVIMFCPQDAGERERRRWMILLGARGSRWEEALVFLAAFELKVSSFALILFLAAKPSFTLPD